MPCITAAPASSLTSQPRTCAPSAANSRASALPRPEATPVTITLRPSNVPMTVSPRWSCVAVCQSDCLLPTVSRDDPDRAAHMDEQPHRGQLYGLRERQRPEREPELADVAGGPHRAARQL